MAEMRDHQSSSEEQLVSPLQSAASPWRRRAGLLLLAHGTICRTEAFVEETEPFAKVVPQPNWQITSGEADLCSKTIDGCSETGCCKTTGYKYTKDTGSTKKSYELDLFAETCMRMHVVEEMDAF